MAKLIPAIGACGPRMQAGERRLAQRLEDKLEDDYLCWYDVSIGHRTLHPDFVIFHPGRGLLVLEVKDWKISTIQSIDKSNVVICPSGTVKQVPNPIEQARQYMFAVTNRMEQDPQLVLRDGPHRGKPLFPYGHGVVLTSITRKQFEDNRLGEAIPSHLVICQDEMTETVDPEAFQKRLWDMFPVRFAIKLSLPQIDRIRWHMFPEIRIPAQTDLFEDFSRKVVEMPDLIRVMDLQQEQLARSLGEGHRVIHGVAGSGKTLILGFRAEHLAKACSRPILVLCYNKALAAKLGGMMAARGLQEKVTVVSFHAWCRRQLQTYNAGLPPPNADMDAFFAAMVDRVIHSVGKNLIPAAQYDAVLIDEGHDFKPEWFKLVVQMIHPNSNSLLVLYDDAQSIYGGKKKLRFSFSSVGVQAKGRTTILKLNYRNTREILAVARAFADELLSPKDEEEEFAPTVQPMSAGRRGPKPLLIEFPTLQAEADYFAGLLFEANKDGTPWSDMAVICRHRGIGAEVSRAFSRKGVPFQMPDATHAFVPGQDGVAVVTMHASKGLEFPLVCIPGVGAPFAHSEEPSDEAKLLYVAMTRATHELVMTHGAESPFVSKMRAAMKSLDAL
ncbi:MAG: NERD domain-containing protein [Elusimicrobia bacterium]|nr:NERD domain-containing protein [Elusimicrobiota bacterium]